LTVSWVSEMGTGSVIGKRTHNGPRTLARSYGLDQPWKRNSLTGLQDHRERGRNLPDGFGFIISGTSTWKRPASSHEVVDTFE
jgi:hypothetical protein